MAETLKSATLLMKTIKQRGRNNAYLWSLLQWDWPIAKDIIDQVYAFFLSAEIPDTPLSELACQVIEEALQRYGTTIFDGPYLKHEDAYRISVFLDTLISVTTAQLIDGISDEKGHVWKVRFDEEQVIWYQQDKLDSDSDDEASLRAQLYGLFACEKLQFCLRRASNEQAILAGSIPALP
ncbi:hypothetical protein [Azomonas macrocytogenes]|uniref:Uncharacterized protein n=1 Tax=Azomonas macrocytogenes TaxID=69962 RepID=A0A839T711_AZOMA|nr:hypothetical protein [Azomonas macrocytogenes]MBB3105242.1 hypothetical protein [Azomonas macrocytogenes]